jgi:hypothetical protein
MKSVMLSKIGNGYLVEVFGDLGDTSKVFSPTAEDALEQVKRVVVDFSTTQASAEES